MTPSLPTALLDTLSRWLDDDGGDRLLDDACAQATAPGIDIAALLDWLQQYRGDPQRKAVAQRRLRAALRLPLIPGPVCRANPRQPRNR